MKRRRLKSQKRAPAEFSLGVNKTTKLNIKLAELGGWAARVGLAGC